MDALRDSVLVETPLEWIMIDIEFFVAIDDLLMIILYIYFHFLFLKI